MYPHRIRLRGPWECEPLARGGEETGPLPPACRMTLPARWGEAGLPGFSGRVRFRRRFGYPGRIDAHERVWLTFAGGEGKTEVWLNGTALGRHDHAGQPFEFEVTSLLQRRNELVVEVEGTEQGGLWGEAALEVRCTAFLRDVRIRQEGERGRLHVSGQVVGTAERPLDLYVLLDRFTVAYEAVRAAPEGHAFHLTADRPSQGTGTVVRVELVNGPVVWYGVEQELAPEPAQGVGG